MKKSGNGCAGWVVAGILLLALIGRGPSDKQSTAAVPEASPASAAASSWRYVQVDALNCRAAPSSTAAVLERLGSDGSVEVINQEDGWSLLNRSSDCWVSSRLLGDAERPRPIQAFAAEPPRRVRSVPMGFAFANCSAARAAGAAPVYAGEPGYARKLDRDGDGVGCE